MACTLTDVIACVPLDLSSCQPSPHDSLNQFLNLISQLRGGSSRYLPLLLAKISDNLPSMAAPIHHMPLSIKQGYAGASDKTPTPSMPPHSFSGSQGFSRDGSAPLSSSGHFSASSSGYPPLSTTPSVERGSMFDNYSPTGSDRSITSGHGFSGGPPLVPMPRSAPAAAAVGGGYGRQR